MWFKYYIDYKMFKILLKYCLIPVKSSTNIKFINIKTWKNYSQLWEWQTYGLREEFLVVPSQSFKHLGVGLGVPVVDVHSASHCNAVGEGVQGDPFSIFGVERWEVEVKPRYLLNLNDVALHRLHICVVEQLARAQTRTVLDNPLRQTQHVVFVAQVLLLKNHAQPLALLRQLSQKQVAVHQNRGVRSRVLLLSLAERHLDLPDVSEQVVWEALLHEIGLIHVEHAHLAYTLELFILDCVLVVGETHLGQQQVQVSVIFALISLGHPVARRHLRGEGLLPLLCWPHSARLRQLFRVNFNSVALLSQKHSSKQAHLARSDHRNFFVLVREVLFHSKDHGPAGSRCQADAGAPVAVVVVDWFFAAVFAFLAQATPAVGTQAGGAADHIVEGGVRHGQEKALGRLGLVDGLGHCE